MHPTQVPDPAAAVHRGVGVEHLEPVPALGQRDPVVVPRLGGEVHDHGHGVAGLVASHEGDHVVVGVVADQPLEAARVLVALVEGRELRLDGVEVAHQLLSAAVQRVLQQPPGQPRLLRPLGPLGELDPHEHQLLAGMGPLEGEIGAQGRGLLPVVAGRLAQQRALAVHDLVMAQRQDEVLRVLVDHREGQLAVVVPAVDRVLAQVLQGVVHPAHVPLEAEAEPAGVGGTGDAGERGGLLGDHHDAGGALVGGRRGLLEEGDVLEVLAPAVDVGNPLPLLAGVVAVEHGGDRVHAQTVDVELLEPVAGVGDEEVAHLVTSRVEDVGAPVGMLAAARVGVLVQRRAVEAAQRPLVLGEVGGDPVHDHADPGAVQGVDEVAQLVGGAEARGGRVVAGDLVAPGPAEGVLGHGHELDVGEAHVGDIGGELLGELPVAQARPPAAKVHLVDRHPGGDRLGGGPLGEPVLVAPLEVARGDHRAGRGRDLGGARHGVRLLPPDAVGPEDPELVHLALADAGHEQLPHPGPAQRAHRVQAAVPAGERADHLDGAGVRRPDGEGGAGHVLDRAHMRAERPPQLLVAALADQVEVELADGGQEAVGLLDVDPVGAVGPGHPDPVGGHLRERQGDGPDPVVLVLHPVRGAVGQQHRDLAREGLQGAHGDAAGVLVGAQHRMGVVVAPRGRGAELVLAQRHHRDGILGAPCGLGHVSSPRDGRCAARGRDGPRRSG